MKKLFKTIEVEESGQGLVEYALILMFIAFAVFAAVGTLGERLGPMLTSVGEALRIN